LVVDDTEDNRDLYAMILGNIGYEVAVAVDGHDGVSLARSIQPSVILMDLAMPNLDGFDATRQIRETPELAGVHIIAVTAFADQRSRQRALAAGCNEVLTKPCAPALLTACVANGVHARAVGTLTPAAIRC
jgi:CheY-like chemotaxis protein